jgi:hypothetical protein
LKQQPQMLNIQSKDVVPNVYLEARAQNLVASRNQAEEGGQM